MKRKIIILLMSLFFLTSVTHSQEKGFYAKASTNIAYPCPAVLCSVGFELNKHFSIGIGSGVLSAAFYDICFPLSLEISGDITKKNIIGNTSLCYSIEPMILLGTNIYYILPKIGLRNNNFHFYLTTIGVNIGYKIQFRKK